MKNPDGLIDFHKIGSIVGYTVLESEIFTIHEEKPKSNTLYVNELLAWNAAWSVVASCRIDDTNEKIKKSNDEDAKEYYEKLIHIS